MRNLKQGPYSAILKQRTRNLIELSEDELRDERNSIKSNSNNNRLAQSGRYSKPQVSNRIPKAPSKNAEKYRPERHKRAYDSLINLLNLKQEYKNKFGMHSQYGGDCSPTAVDEYDDDDYTHISYVQEELDLVTIEEQEYYMMKIIMEYEQAFKRLATDAIAWHNLMYDVENNEHIAKMWTDLQIIRRLKTGNN